MQARMFTPSLGRQPSGTAPRDMASATFAGSLKRPRRNATACSVDAENFEACFQAAFAGGAQFAVVVGRGQDRDARREVVEQRQQFGAGTAAGVVEFVDALDGPVAEQVAVAAALAPLAHEIDANRLAVDVLDCE